MVLRNTLIEPELLRLKIRLETSLRVALKVCHVKTVFRQLINVGKEVPGVFNSFFL